MRSLVSVGVIALALLAGCGERSAATRAPLRAAPPDAAAATATVITPGLSSRSGDAAFAPVTGTVSVSTGDGLRTDGTGFAEVAFSDGSLTRLDALTDVDLSELTAQDGTSITVTTGRVWARTKAGSAAADLTVITPLASATAARDTATAGTGAAFAVDCRQANTCTFTVLAGSISLVTSDGRASDLAAPRSVTVSATPSG